MEGNLLAADQELKRLSLLYADKGPITDTMMLDYVGDNARFDSFELLEASFNGDARRVTRILTGLKLEGEAAAKISYMLVSELRTLTKMSWDWSQAGKMKDGKPFKTKDSYGKYTLPQISMHEVEDCGKIRPRNAERSYSQDI